MQNVVNDNYPSNEHNTHVLVGKDKVMCFQAGVMDFGVTCIFFFYNNVYGLEKGRSKFHVGNKSKDTHGMTKSCFSSTSLTKRF